DAALRSFASPTPSITKLIVPDSIVAGKEPFTLTVEGNYLTDATVIIFRGNALSTTAISFLLLAVNIPAFSGNSSIRIYTPPVTPKQNDGGFSDSLFFFTSAKKTITIIAANTTRRYGEQNPDLKADIFVDSIPLDSTNYTLAELGLDSLYFTTPAT